MKTIRLNTKINALAGASILAMASAAQAVVIDFTGGTATMLDASTGVTNNAASFTGVDYYEENGFRLDFIPDTGSAGFATAVGDYYAAGNDVIHTHWATGSFGGVTQVDITKIGGGTFDLNYFILTSNTDLGGGPASGFESAWIKNNLGYEQKLPVENWGFPATQIFLGSQFDTVTTVSFFVKNSVDCFGMDEFYINEAAPPSVPDGGTTASLFGLALLGMAAVRRKLRLA